jgi:hypothetical protein
MNKHADDDDSYKYYEEEPYRIQYELANRTAGGKLIGKGWSFLRSLFVVVVVVVLVVVAVGFCVVTTLFCHCRRIVTRSLFVTVDANRADDEHSGRMWHISDNPGDRTCGGEDGPRSGY